MRSDKQPTADGFQELGALLVRDGYAAHYRSSVDDKALCAGLIRSSTIRVSAKYRRVPGFYDPIEGHLDFDSAHQRKDIQHSFILNLRFAKVDLSASHDGRQVTTTKLL
jgi:hypothetical protein